MADATTRLMRPSLSFALLAGFLSMVLLSGGASRADAFGQVVVRVVAWALLLVAVLFGRRPRREDVGPTALLLGAALLLVLLQLIPLPPAIWQALPGRGIFAEAASAGGRPQPWRPWSIVPGATVNAASSLVVPITTLVLMAGLAPEEQPRVPGLLLCLIGVSALIGLLQFSGAQLDNPLVNDTPGEVSGLFANRNHFALFTAIGCLLAPAWAFQEGRAPHWRGPLAPALVLVFALIVLASGSRAGIILAVLGSGVGMLLAWKGIGRSLRRYPRWVFTALLAGGAALVATTVLISIAAGRAVSISRALAIDPGQDMRSRGLPTVWGMIREYFPMGSGLGGFDPIFRLHEPFGLLKLTFFNHAHNDFLELALDAGLPGLLLLAVALAWWGWAGLKAWRSGDAAGRFLPRLGSTILLLILIASAFDYPARTPMIMAVAVVAALWLDDRGRAVGRSALPGGRQHL